MKLTVEQFNALSRSEKKVLVAKDVIAQVKAEKIIARKGCYFSKYYDDKYDDKSARDNMKLIEGCQVCALGAAMVSITKFANRLTIEQLGYFNTNKDALQLLSEVFTPKEMLLIETAFEGYNPNACRVGIDHFNVDPDIDELKSVASKYYYEYSNPTERLIALMKNIIKNNGEFII